MARKKKEDIPDAKMETEVPKNLERKLTKNEKRRMREKEAKKNQPLGWFNFLSVFHIHCFIKRFFTSLFRNVYI